MPNHKPDNKRINFYQNWVELGYVNQFKLKIIFWINKFSKPNIIIFDQI